MAYTTEIIDRVVLEEKGSIKSSIISSSPHLSLIILSSSPFPFSESMLLEGGKTPSRFRPLPPRLDCYPPQRVPQTKKAPGHVHMRKKSSLAPGLHQGTRSRTIEDLHRDRYQCIGTYVTPHTVS